ncbi:MAG: M20/M25/M40 family metallo-hydrolase [Oscillospiraceae bacterium]|nr:M20/M25/M40 family metallo-hydrolase [Oscillospiraceae bacterium]
MVTICQIPAPSNQEEKRAAFCKEWLEGIGAENVTIDKALNVVYPMNCEGSSEIVAVMAHSDTVFPDLEPMPLRIEDGKIFSPGIGDDTANVAILLMIVKFILENHLTPRGAMMFVIDSGEEGLGNLKGCRQIMEDYAGRIKEVIALDGTYTSMVTGAVGSMRYRVEVLTEGGHSYGHFGNRNAIHLLSSMIGTLYDMKVPEGGRTTYNVGTIEGGTSVNTIAQQASMLYEFRSDCKESLEMMDRFFQSVVESYRAMGITVNVELLGLRPCTGKVDSQKQADLIERCRKVMTYYTQETQIGTGAASTDCNIPLSLGIPAVCFGGYVGHKGHTRQEFVELDSLQTGPLVVGTVLTEYFH